MKYRILSGHVLALFVVLSPPAPCAEPRVEDSIGSVYRIPAMLFRGEGLEPRSSEGPGLSSKALFDQGFYLGLTHVAKAFSTPAKGYPGDEYILVLRGWLRLAESDGSEQLFAVGSRAFIPKGWAGVWTNSADYLEFVITSTEFLAAEENGGWPPNAPIDANARILAVDLQHAPEVACAADGGGQRELLACWSGAGEQVVDDRIAIEYQVAEQALEFDLPRHALGEYVEVLAGTLTAWQEGKESQVFVAGDHVIVSADFSGRIAFSEGYRGLVISGDPTDS